MPQEPWLDKGDGNGERGACKRAKMPPLWWSLSDPEPMILFGRTFVLGPTVTHERLVFPELQGVE